MEEKKKLNVGVGEFAAVIFIIILAIITLVAMLVQRQESIEENAKLKEQVMTLETEISSLKSQQKSFVNSISSSINQATNILQSQKNTINSSATTQETTTQETSNTNTSSNNSSNQTQKFTFSTPVGDGKFEVYAQKAVQATGFAGASAHIFYLKDGELYYHNEAPTDVKLATGITNLTLENQDIIATKGSNAQILVNSQYVQYK